MKIRIKGWLNARDVKIIFLAVVLWLLVLTCFLTSSVVLSAKTFYIVYGVIFILSALLVASTLWFNYKFLQLFKHIHSFKHKFILSVAGFLTLGLMLITSIGFMLYAGGLISNGIQSYSGKCHVTVTKKQYSSSSRRGGTTHYFANLAQVYMQENNFLTAEITENTFRELTGEANYPELKKHESRFFNCKGNFDIQYSSSNTGDRNVLDVELQK
jgi:hypothetical protein